MSNVLALIQQQAAAIAEVSNDFNEAQAGGGGRLLKEGPVLARLVRYTDFGKQPQEFQGKAKDPLNEFSLGFALYGPDYANEDGTPYIIETFGITESYTSKSGAYLLFQAMNWQKVATCFPQLIGQLFIVDIKTHLGKREGAKPRSIVNLKTVRPPLDPMSGQPYNAPPVPDSYYRLFSWTMPTLEAWHSLYVPGTWDDGGSKNRLQETILSAVDFAGSPLETLLLTNNVPFVIPAPKAKQPAVGAQPAAVGAVPLAQPAPLAAAPAVAAVPGVAPSPIIQQVMVQEVPQQNPAGIVQTAAPLPQANNLTTYPSDAVAAPVVAPVVAPVAAPPAIAALPVQQVYVPPAVEYTAPALPGAIPQ